MMKNQLSKVVDKLNNKPAWLRKRALTYVLGSTIKFVGTAGIKCIELSGERAVFRLANRKKVRNHIGTVHAAASALVAETASGIALGMHLPDDKLPLLKSMQVDYTKRSTGALTASASLTQEQIELLYSQDKGTIVVDCKVVDDAGIEPVQCQMHWAWTLKRK
jgi:acyl-coenzyme A thioesterase PaaI-like protein